MNQGNIGKGPVSTFSSILDEKRSIRKHIEMLLKIIAISSNKGCATGFPMQQVPSTCLSSPPQHNNNHSELVDASFFISLDNRPKNKVQFQISNLTNKKETWEKNYDCSEAYSIGSTFFYVVLLKTIS